MEEGTISTQSCRVCGAPVSSLESMTRELCERCASAQSSQQPSGSYDPWSAAPYETSVASVSPQAPPDPDHPQWGPLAATGVWFFNVAITVVIQIIAVVAWVIIARASGRDVPLTQEGMKDWLTSPPLLLLQVLSSVPAHILTLALCWAIVTGLQKRSFWDSLGWHWAGKSAVYWICVSALVVVGIVIADSILGKVIPQHETPFDELLKSSRSVRFAIAGLAVITAPLVEEIVYRGVIFGALRKHLSSWLTVLLVTVIFTGVHVPQYWGAWAGLTGLTFLSLVLGILRARTSSILPCFIVHLINNAFLSVFIILGKF
jgi:CAAX protease family protein